MTDGEGTARDGTRAAQAVPRETTPTWEMELLLSGATVVGLLQLPRELNALFFDALNRVTDDLTLLLTLLWTYAQTSLLLIIATFLLHLVLRGYWIALVGLDSVYPGGIRWDRLRLGPHLRALNEAKSPSMPDRLEEADDRATRVFGVGFGLSLAILVPMAVVLAGLAGYLAALGLGVAPRAGLWAFWLLVGLGIGPFLLLFLLDRALGHRLPPQRLAGRLLRRTLGLYARFGLGRAANPLLSLYQSNAGARRTGAVVALAIVAASSLVVARMLLQVSGASWGDFAGLPEDEPAAADTAFAEHYATQRGREPSPIRLPFIPDRVVRGPYLELFVPYRPRRLAPALRRACPEAVAVAEAGGPARGALDCLAGLLDVRVDGAGLAVNLVASSDPVTSQRGVLAMIPVDGLAPGAHELTLLPAPRPDPRPGDPPRRPYRIPFWR